MLRDLEAERLLMEGRSLAQVAEKKESSLKTSFKAREGAGMS